MTQPQKQNHPRLMLCRVMMLFAFVAALCCAWFGFLRWELDPKVPGGWIYKQREHQNRVAFDSEAWKRNLRATNEWPKTDLLPIRLRMVDDLMAKQDFKGRSHQEIELLLGPKTKTEYFSDWDLVYYLGPGRYGNAVGDSEWLVFRFDATGRVKDYKIVHD